MDILIRGMEMPTRCWDCLLNTYGYCMASEHSDIIPSDEPIPEWCPLIPVPPHGRLIDADALLMRINHEVMEAYIDGVCYGVHPNQEHLYLLGEIIDDAPTVIPAEEGEV